MTFNTRTQYLKSADLPLMRSLMIVFGEAFNEPATFSKAPPDDAYFERLLEKEDFIAIVATKGDAVVGGLTAYVLDKYEQVRREIYVYDLAVAEPHRREGVATALLNHLREIGQERSAYVLLIQADYGDEPAIGLYTKLGTREDVLHFDIDVAAPKLRGKGQK